MASLMVGPFPCNHENNDFGAHTDLHFPQMLEFKYCGDSLRENQMRNRRCDADFKPLRYEPRFVNSH